MEAPELAWLVVMIAGSCLAGIAVLFAVVG